MKRFNAAFKKWFGRSQVVDANGEPLVVYHGTSSVPFSSFHRVGAQGRGYSNRYLFDDNDLGFFFDAHPGSPPDLAEPWHGAAGFAGVRQEGGEPRARSGARTIPVYLSLQNPMTLAMMKYVEFVQAHGGGLHSAVWLKNHGYDGVIRLDSFGEPGHFVALYPEQIKSVYNRGTWDPGDPDIRRNPDEYGRALLAETMKEVRQRVSAETIKKSWGIRSRGGLGCGYAEFHIPPTPEFPEGFYYHDQDKSVAEIKAEGWEAALRQLSREDPDIRRNPRAYITFPVRTLPVPAALLRDAETVRRRVMKKFLSRPRERQLQWYCTTVAEAAYAEFLKLGYSHRERDPKAVWTESTGHHYVVVRYGGREYIVDLWTIGAGQEHRIAPIARVWDSKDPAVLEDSSYERQVFENPDIRRNPEEEQRSLWITPQGELVEVAHTHHDTVMEQWKVFGIPTDAESSEACNIAIRNGGVRIVASFQDGEWMWGGEVYSFRDSRPLRNLARVLGEFPAEAEDGCVLHLDEAKTGEHRTLSVGQLKRAYL